MFMLIQNFNEPRHVRAFEIMGQTNIHIKVRYCVLLAPGTVTDNDRMLYILYADLVNSDMTCVPNILGIWDFSP